mmetsp:Transcript_41907/g.108539  ORF Transcript_41907/g.108539 Transcript_41907/m.108539 type:complete len:324 (+) Transcript_41907:565-1536(+)
MGASGASNQAAMKPFWANATRTGASATAAPPKTFGHSFVSLTSEGRAARRSTQCTDAGLPQATATECELRSTAAVRPLLSSVLQPNLRSAARISRGARASHMRTAPSAATSKAAAMLPTASQAMISLPGPVGTATRSLSRRTVAEAMSNSCTVWAPRAAATIWPPPDPPRKWRPDNTGAHPPPPDAWTRPKPCMLLPASLMLWAKIWPSVDATTRASLSGAKSKHSTPNLVFSRSGGRRLKLWQQNRRTSDASLDAAARSERPERSEETQKSTEARIAGGGLRSSGDQAHWDACVPAAPTPTTSCPQILQSKRDVRMLDANLA